MNAWAARFGKRAAFILVGCAGPDLAVQFGRELKLGHTTNTYIANMRQHGPTWGQLGCSGFIVLDATGAVVCAKSAAYLEVKRAAFDEVETLLLDLLDESDAASRETTELTSV